MTSSRFLCDDREGLGSKEETFFYESLRVSGRLIWVKLVCGRDARDAKSDSFGGVKARQPQEAVHCATAR